MKGKTAKTLYMNNCFLIILLFILYVNQPCDGVPLIIKNNLTFLLNYQWHPVARQLPKYKVMIRYEACVNKYFFKYMSSQIFPCNNLGLHIVVHIIKKCCRSTNDMLFEYFPWLVYSRVGYMKSWIAQKGARRRRDGARENNDTSPMEVHTLHYLLYSTAPGVKLVASRPGKGHQPLLVFDFLLLISNFLKDFKVLSRFIQNCI